MDTRSHQNINNPFPRVGDISDWRLIVYMRRDGMSAYLKNVENPTRPVEHLFHTFWEPDEEQLLHHIENAVYDHSQILDDFTTDIIIETTKVMWVPLEELDEEGQEEKIFTSVYKVEGEDIHVDRLDDMAALYTLTPGLTAFLQRTFPGARIMNQMTPEINKFRERGLDMPRIYIDLREREADFLGFDGKKMLIAASHSYSTCEDIAYHLFNILEVYGLDPRNIQVSLSGGKEQQSVKQQLASFLRKYVAYVMFTMLPRLTGNEDMPLAAALCANRLPNKRK